MSVALSPPPFHPHFSPFLSNTRLLDETSTADSLPLAEAFGNITKLWTNDTGDYALTAQEDNASFEAMIRADKAGLMDFSRVILMRTASDFDRAPPDQGT